MAEHEETSQQNHEFYAETVPVWMSKRDRIFLLQIQQGKVNRDHVVWAQSMLDRFAIHQAIGDPHG